MPDTIKLPKVSIGLPVYNGEAYLALTIESLLAQTHDDIELTICDNASTDSTEKICRKFAQRDSRIVYHRNVENIGAAKNFAKVFQLATADYFMWAAHDDLWDPTYIERCVRALEEDPDAVLGCSDILFIDEAGQLNTKKVYNFNASRRSPTGRIISLATTRGNMLGWFEIYGVIRTNVLRKTRLSQNLFGGDVLLLMELFMHGPFVKVPEKLFLYRQFRNKTLEDMMVAIDLENANRTWPHPLSDLAQGLLDVIGDSNFRPRQKLWLKAVFLGTLALRNPRWVKRIKKENRKIALEALRKGNLIRASRATAIYLASLVSRGVGKTNLGIEWVFRSTAALFTPKHQN